MLLEEERHPEEDRVSAKIILLVEDNVVYAEYLAQIIVQETSYHVFIANDARAALKFAKYSKPHLFIIDHHLPEMNGIHLYDLIHTNRELKDIPAIIISASLENCRDEIHTRKLIGISKSFDLDELLRCLEEILA
jgi:DNA-binding response OmpR family regulator